MSCARGKASPSEHTRLRLHADSAGFCQRPECLRRLFETVSGKIFPIAEMAHIFAANDGGPRANAKLTEEERGAYENLILLCPNCHTIIDKAPQEFPDDVIRGWKEKHVERIGAAFGAIEYGSRSAARNAIAPILAENRLIFDDVGPENDYNQDPESELAQVWERKVRLRILPNNRRLLSILDKNRAYLNAKELTVLEQFRQHVDDFEARHLGEGPAAVGRRFPEGMEAILENGNG
jgi:hypothetical protein